METHTCRKIAPPKEVGKQLTPMNTPKHILYAVLTNYSTQATHHKCRLSRLVKVAASNSSRVERYDQNEAQSCKALDDPGRRFPEASSQSVGSSCEKNIFLQDDNFPFYRVKRNIFKSQFATRPHGKLCPLKVCKISILYL